MQAKDATGKSAKAGVMRDIAADEERWDFWA